MRRLRAKVRNLPSGTPWATVRSNYVGLPSMAGRGPDERRRKPPGSGGAKPPVRARKYGPKAQSRRCGAPRGVALSVIGRARRKAWTDFVAPRGAPIPHVSKDKRIRAHPAPTKEYGR